MHLINGRKLQLHQEPGTGGQNIALVSMGPWHAPRRYVHQQDVFAVLAKILPNRPTFPNSPLRDVKQSREHMHCQVEVQYTNISKVPGDDFFRALDAAYYLFGNFDYGTTPRTPRPQGSNPPKFKV
jgi:hypothetical protein